MTSMPGYGVGSGNYGSDGGRERGARRKKLAAMAGSMYKAGTVAVNEIRESYNQTRTGEMDTPEASKITIPGSFPDVAIVTKGNEQMVLFPSYAKRHVKGEPSQFENPGGPPDASSMGMDEQEYWKYEWARHEDEKAVVDVDVRGWIYNPHRGPMTRRNRVMIGLARQLSGIPAPRAQQANATADADPSLSSIHQQHEEERERDRIAKEAREIERRGQAEKEAAQKGGYSERPKDEDSEDEGDRRLHRIQSGNQPARSAPPSPTHSARSKTGGTGANEMSDTELAVANANLMARIGPFMTTPLAEHPITLFFYNDTASQSRTVMTDDSGHFITRAALDFVPTHVRVLANEDISCTEPINIIEPKGVSLISDIDDTIKHSNIALGAKEIFRNTFVRDLDGLMVDGVQDWYTRLHDLGVMIHYCSNSPWQLYPVLATYFKLAGLPPGSLHLKRYTGMLQGIFEPVAERKKGTLEKIMKDFPERKFLLVGDSGEADLEVYTELAVANPGRIVAVFIRDVTTPERAGYFDSGFGAGNGRNLTKVPGIRVDQGARNSSDDDPSSRPALPSRVATQPATQDSVMGDLIDLSEEPQQLRRVESADARDLKQGLQPQSEKRAADLPGRKAPPKPAKPTSLRSVSASSVNSTTNDVGNNYALKKAPSPPQPRRATSSSRQSSGSSASHPLSQMHNSSQQTIGSPRGLTNSRHGSQPATSNSSTSTSGTSKTPGPPPPPPRRRGTPSSVPSRSPRPRVNRRRTGDSDIDFEALPAPAGTSRRTAPTGADSPNEGPVNRKLDMWRRRLERAQDTLDRHGVALYTWRRGDDVVHEAEGIVKQKLKELGLKVGGSR